MITMLANLGNLEHIDLLDIYWFYDCGSFLKILKVINKFHLKSLKSLGIASEILSDRESIEILRNFKKLTTIIAENFSLQFQNNQ